MKTTAIATFLFGQRNTVNFRSWAVSCNVIFLRRVTLSCRFVSVWDAKLSSVLVAACCGLWCFRHRFHARGELYLDKTRFWNVLVRFLFCIFYCVVSLKSFKGLCLYLRCSFVFTFMPQFVLVAFSMNRYEFVVQKMLNSKFFKYCCFL